MTERGPANGYTWTAREMMMRRDKVRWRRAHAWVRWAPLPALIAFPVGTMAGLFGFIISAAEQSHQLHSPFARADEEFARPIMIQRFFAVVAIIQAVFTLPVFGVLSLLGGIGAILWLAMLQIAKAKSKEEREIDRANREATTIDDTRIKE